eukprot:scaffold26550_cov122-Cylindrotheca_fusiformis.AAC.3
MNLPQFLLIATAVVALIMAATMMTSPEIEMLEQESPVRRRQLLQESRNRPLKVLYTVTTLAEYDVGSRATTKGADRMQNVLIPVVKEGVDSMIRQGYEVDVFIISFYKMTRLHLIQQALPPNVNISVWDEAAPISYKGDEHEKAGSKLHHNTIGLARQHRFVVKDHLFQYDLFCNFEDDMIIHGDHIENYIEMTKELYRLRELATNDKYDNTQGFGNFFGPLSKEQLKRTLPGFIRVEALLDEEKYGTQEALDPIPVTDRPEIDPKPCCHLRNESLASPNRPPAPHSDKLFMWEVGIKAVGIRHMPKESSLGWVLLQRGPSRGKDVKVDYTISDFWSNRNNKYFNERRPASISFEGINNQGGWMATQRQIWEWHTEVCPGGFLPPYEAPHYRFDGLDMRNVEWWSGGISLVTARHACNMQRLISLEPSRFARQLLYHSANNKQRQLTWKKKKFVKVNDFYAQLLTVQKDAQQEMEKQQ